MLIIYVTTVPVTFGFLTHQMHMLRKGGFEVHAVSSPGQALDDIEREFGIPTHAINMQRRMTPLADLWGALQAVAAIPVTSPGHCQQSHA
jgi:hypothetical protein